MMYEDAYTLDCEFNPVTMDLREVAIVRARDSALQFYTNVDDVDAATRLATLHLLTHFIHNKIIIGCDLSGDWLVLRKAFASANIPMPKPRMAINIQDVHQLLHGDYTHVKASLSKLVVHYGIAVPYNFKNHFAHFDALKIAWVFRSQLSKFADFTSFRQALSKFHTRMAEVRKFKREQYTLLIGSKLKQRNLSGPKLELA
jgi:hypothetical protein